MCNCIKELQKPERYKGRNGEAIREPTIENWAFVEVDKKLKLVTATTLSYRIEGKKKKLMMDLPHNFCPFCGEKHQPEPVEVIQTT